MNAEQGAAGVTLHSVAEVDGLPVSAINNVTLPVSGKVTGLATKGTGAYNFSAVGSGASVILTAGAAATFIEIWNVSASGTLWLSIGGTPTVAGAGCIPVPPMTRWRNPPGYVPTDAIQGISDGPTINVTVGAA